MSLAFDWRELACRCKGSFFFQSPAWCQHVLNELSSVHADETFDPVVVTVWRDKTLVAVWPLSLRKEYGIRILTSLAGPFDQYTDMLCDDSEAGAEIVGLIVNSLKRMLLADGMILRKVRTTSAVRGLERNGATVIDEGSRAPQVQFEEGQPFSDFIAGVNAKTRKNIRNYKNRLMRKGRLEHKVLRGAAVAEALRTSFLARRDWLDDNGLSSAGFRDANFERVVCNLAANNSHDLGLVAFVLTFNGKMIAIQWGFIHQGCYHAYMSSRDPEFESYSIGRIHLQLVLEECHRLGVVEVDLMVPNAPYKLTWATSTDAVVDLVWPWSKHAYLRTKAYEQFLRPRLKHLARRLPHALRRQLISRFNAPGPKNA